MKKISFAFLFILIVYTNTNAQFNEFHAEYDWFTIKGKHVYVHYHREAERTARLVCKIADEVWGPITSLYGYEPDPVHFLIKDIDDYSNGATYFFDNKIEIWSSALDFDLRGTHNWLRNVISHEFTHMVQIQAGMKLTRNLPAFYIQFLNYEDKRRPDILYGFPNAIVSYPIATINIPSWFAEGTAQYMRKDFDYDNWDSHRDMILRSYAIDGNMLTWNQMGVFDKTSLGNESVYNSGFALTRYISQKYGEDKLRLITKRLGSWKNFTMDAAIEDVLGISGIELYNEWKDFVTADYKRRIADVESNTVKGEIINYEGFGNFYPRFNKAQDKIYYVSNKYADYFGLTSLYEYDTKTKTSKIIKGGIRSTVGLVNNTNKLVYAKLSDDNKNWANIHDLYIYDMDTEDETRLTFGLRANNPDVSSDGKKIVFLYQMDGTTNLGTVDIDGKNFKRLTFFENGELVYNPKFSLDNKQVYFDYSYHQGRDIAKVDTTGANFEFVINTDKDERNVSFCKNGDMIYSSNETGIFNIYKYNFETKAKKQLTNVIGGAFMSAVDDSGNISYAGYTSSGYKIFYITKSEQQKVDETKKYIQINNPPLQQDKPNGDIENFDIVKLKNFNDYETPEYKEEKYSGFFSKVSFFPFIRYDNYNTSGSTLDKIKPGVFVSSNDYLNRYGFFAGGSINKRGERDLFLTFEYRNKLPLLYGLGIKPEVSLELYSISRKANVDIIFDEYDDSYSTSTDVTYNLFEVDFVAKHKIFAEGNNIETRFIYSDYVAALGSFVVPNSSSLYPTTKDKYFVGKNIQIKYTHEIILPTVDNDINPIGRTIELQYNYEFSKYNPDGNYTVENSTLVPVYKDYKFSRVELNYKEHISVFGSHTLNTQIRVGTILAPQVPDFFDYYLGGLIGMRAYPFYAISGNEVAWFNLTYRFPLFRNIDGRFGHLYLDKVFLSVYGDFGNAWTGNQVKWNEFKKGAGAELRVKFVSFYIFPTSLFFNAAYSFDKYDRKVDRGANKITYVSYGKEWQFYGGILFDFSF